MNKINRVDIQWMLALALIIQCSFVSGAAVTRATKAAVLEVNASSDAVITIDSESVIRDEMPSTLFGFNINHYHFGREFWQENKRRVNEGISDALKPFGGAIYRYPGGLVANSFNWKETIGPSKNRKLQKAVKWDRASRVLFGIDEYMDFVKSIGGHQWYVLNLVGWDDVVMVNELPDEQIAKSNAELAEYFKEHYWDTGFPRYYQLGNELDRATYQWSHDKYIQRAKSTMEAINNVDPDAKFVAFLRDFDWKYKGEMSNRGVSRSRDFIKDVLEGLPTIDDFSLHYYYDEPENIKKYSRIGWRLKQFRRAIDGAARVRRGKVPNVWITEHAKAIDLSEGGAMKKRDTTSNLAATLSTSDFLIALAQFPEIKGAVWHGLTAGPWQLFDVTIKYNDLRPRPVYWGLRVLRTMELPVVLATYTSSPNLSGYKGGYDIRAAAFTDKTGDKLGAWLVNRATVSTEVEIRYAPWQKQSVSMRHYYIAGEEGGNPEDPDLSPIIQLNPEKVKARFSETGSLKVKLPPASVSSFVISKVGGNASIDGARSGQRIIENQASNH